MTFIPVFLARSDGDVYENGEGILRDAYWRRHAFNWLKTWRYLHFSCLIDIVSVSLINQFHNNA